jgi:LVIVD repeat
MGRDVRAPPQTLTTGGDMSMSASAKALAAIVAAVLVLPAAAGAAPGTLNKVGHEPLMKRGMNAAIAIHGDYAYIGSRTDGGHEDMPHGGIMVVDISNPGELDLLGKPLYPRAGESTRELRVWRSQDILIVLNTNCGVGGQAPSLHSALDQQLPLLRHIGRERAPSRRDQPVQRRHARVLPLGGPLEPRAGTDLRR